MAASRDKVIITCAVTGAIHTPTMTPYLPITPAEIADGAIGAWKAGAAIIHLHARDPKDGRPTPDPKVFMQFLPAIKAETDAVINITTGGGHNMTVQQRLEAPLAAKPEMCSLNMGSMNFGLFQLGPKYREWKFDWEPQYLENTRDFIFRNTYKDIEFSLKHLGEECGTKFEFECYDVGHLYNLAHFVDRGLIKPPMLIQTIYGILGGIGPEAENLMHMRRIAMGLITMGAIMGGHCRVGLEDSIYLKKGQLAKSNAEQVTKIRTILNELSLEIATADDARQMLALKGRNNVGF